MTPTLKCPLARRRVSAGRAAPARRVLREIMTCSLLQEREVPYTGVGIILAANGRSANIRKGLATNELG